jgi:hypothetical protein
MAISAHTIANAATTTDPPFTDFLGRLGSVLGGHRNLPLVGRPLVATGTSPTMKKLNQQLGPLSSPINCEIMVQVARPP